MNRGLSLSAFGHATSLFFALTYTFCVVFDLIFPAHAAYQAWFAMMPGFALVHAGWMPFTAGLLKSYLCGGYVALVWVPLYNVFASRGRRDVGTAAKRAA